MEVVKYNLEDILSKGLKQLIDDFIPQPGRRVKQKLGLLHRSSRCKQCQTPVRHLEYWKGEFMTWRFTNRDSGKVILFTIDHIVPKSKGGANTLDNLQIMCEQCNWDKADKVSHTFKTKRI
jgi:5-methylcytosine-specific restriction endonuclease McrA